MADLKLTLACGDYEITRALKDGSVRPKGIELVVDSRFGPRERHWAMAKDNAYDICEFNAGAYFMARDRGFPWTAIPTFCHRRFRHGFVFVNTKKNIREPKDLIGKKVGGTNFQPAGNIWIRGIIEDEFAVPHREIHWFTERGEDIDFTPAEKLRITRIGEGQSLNAMLLDGELDALIEPETPKPFLEADPRIARLFADHKKVEQDYYARTGIFPIMHVTVIQASMVEKNPWVVQSLMDAFNESKQRAYARVSNPRVVPLAWWTAAWEEQKQILGSDPWEYGLTPGNRKNLDTMVRYCSQQGLISREIPIDDLFVTN